MMMPAEPSYNFSQAPTCRFFSPRTGELLSESYSASRHSFIEGKEVGQGFCILSLGIMVHKQMRSGMVYDSPSHIYPLSPLGLDGTPVSEVGLLCDRRQRHSWGFRAVW